MDVKGKAALITGGGSGIGAECMRHLARAGMKVAALDVNIDGARAVAAETGGIAVECNVTSSDSAEAAVKAARDRHGIAQVLINCAGVGTVGRIIGRNGPMPLADFERTIAINLTGSFNLMRLAVFDMYNVEPGEDGERGMVVNTASVAAFEGQIGQAAYASSKGGIVALTLQAAREFASRGVRVNTISPGLIETPMLLGLPEAAQQSLREQPEFPKRLGRPEEYARLVLHLAGNVLINGTVIRLDGALRMAAR
ncbi:MAG: SDR family NAD(P)-dependent oxidoreductase [Alphaproteobacteria bacterium]|nr:SDR family NAD(P)-dependent oxidoreductase [Alphaproteobacteria bacterium]